MSESLVKEELSSTLDKKKGQTTQKPPAKNDKFKLPDDDYEEEPFEEEYIN